MTHHWCTEGGSSGTGPASFQASIFSKTCMGHVGMPAAFDWQCQSLRRNLCSCSGLVANCRRPVISSFPELPAFDKPRASPLKIFSTAAVRWRPPADPGSEHLTHVDKHAAQYLITHIVCHSTEQQMSTTPSGANGSLAQTLSGMMSHLGWFFLCNPLTKHTNHRRTQAPHNSWLVMKTNDGL